MSQQINLFNPVFTRQGKYFSTVMMVQGLGMLALVSALGCGFLYYQTEQAKARFEIAKQQHDKLQKMGGDQLGSKTKAQLQAEFDRLQAESKQQGMQFSAYLRAFARQGMDGVWLSGIELKNSPISLVVTGNALYPALVTHYLQQLGQEPLFQAVQVEMPSLNKVDGMATQDYVTFKLNITGKEK
ncbi:Fimbrial assembly family protein [Ferriphaselus amnicola]|uniref:Fimbrial assembly family protein n=1 Tax=Ferriphaselus amnicola TaxID=1188319 RepID=A0A2Z6G9B6_9PROT|nr:PilN domain-containing protein [Ferriphaselus amnicola]BBE50003.1 Fimbrial assembly family protein [Ferriphaselus amnicola]